MTYEKTVELKNGKTLLLRNGTAKDSAALLYVFNATHAETDFMLTYPDECSYTVEEEADFLQKKTDSDNAIEILAFLDGRAVGCAGIDTVGTRVKLRHRAEFGICVLREYWGLGIGRALTQACVECAAAAGYRQLELDVVAENERAIALYHQFGFTEYGRNPRGFLARGDRYQELVLMRLELQ